MIDEEKDIIDEKEDDENSTEQEEQEQNDSAEDPNDKIDNQLLEDRHDYVVDVNLSEEMEKSFLSYAMSVIVARALPDVRDGMKPVHRRILHTMGELGVFSDKQHKKSARIVGDCMGKYHPHGDTAIYEAMVRMAQDFSYRYPLVDGHGDFGSVDGDGAAAMRYTEARMAKITAELLRDINKNTVDFQDNYDGSEREPVVLPARFPNLLVNGATGIAVGMATNIPPHNLTEVINGVLALIDNPEITIDELMEHITAPDFPTGGKIMGLSSVRQAYATGTGTITIRAKTKIANLSNNKKEIIITEIPYQVNKTKLIERIADLAKEKTIEGITDLRDESSRKGMRIIIELRRDANSGVILNNLYKYTQLQTTYSINMIALDKGQPKTLTLKQILECYVEHQVNVITRRTEFDLNKNKARLHIVQGLLVALADIDEVVRIIKESKTDDEALNGLMNAFELTEIQSKAILDMRLRRLTGLEIDKLKQEEGELEKIVKYLEEILADHSKKMQVIKDELVEIQRKYGDERKSEIDLTEDLEVADEDLIPVEDVIITMTNRGYIKRMTVDTYRVQRRGGKGITGAKMQEEDFIERVIYTSTHDNLLFFSNFGKVYDLKAFQIPQSNRTAKGLPLVNLLKFDEGERLAAVINVKSLEEPGFLLFATRKGIIKKTELIQYKNIRSTGIRAINLNEGDELFEVKLTDGTKDIIFGASNGKAARFEENTVRPTNRSATGVKGIKIADGEQAIGLAVVDSENDQIMIITDKGYGKRTSADDFKVKGRNGKGVKFININDKVGKPVGLINATDEDDLMVITDGGMIIRTHLDQISCFGRDTQGVRIIRLAENQKVASIAIVPRADETEEVEEEVSTDSDVKELLENMDNSFDQEYSDSTDETEDVEENNDEEE